MAGEERWAGLLAERQDGTAQDGQGLGGLRVFKARRVLTPLRIASPMVFVLDAPVAAHDLRELRGPAVGRLEAGDKEALAGGRLVAFLGALRGAGDAQDGPREGETEGFGFDGDDPQLVVGDPAMGLVVTRKGGGALSSTPRA